MKSPPAIEDKDCKALPDELGDLLFQVVFHARMAEEAGLFDFGDVVEAVTAKMIRRHPHVFGDDRAAADPPARRLAWEEIKASEAPGQGRPDQPPGRCSHRPARPAACRKTSTPRRKRRIRLG